MTAPESVLVIFGNYQRKLGSNTSVLRTNRILRLEMMKGGARFRLDLDEGWCETLHYITIHHKGIGLDEGWCETLYYITVHQKRIDLDEGWCETLHYITIHQKRTDFDEGWCVFCNYWLFLCALFYAVLESLVADCIGMAASLSSFDVAMCVDRCKFAS